MRGVATTVLAGLALSSLAACGTPQVNTAPQLGTQLQVQAQANQSTFKTQWYRGFGWGGLYRPFGFGFGYGLGYGLGYPFYSSLYSPYLYGGLGLYGLGYGGLYSSLYSPFIW